MSRTYSFPLNLAVGAAFSLSIIAHMSGYSIFNGSVLLVWIGLAFGLGVLFHRVGLLMHVVPMGRRLAVNATILATCLATGAAIYYMSPVRSTVFPRSAALTLAYDGRNPQSKGDEIWAKVMLPGAVSVPPAEVGAGWELKEGGTVMAKSANTSGIVRWNVPVHRQATLQLTRHEWSGIARVDWNGNERAVDLFSIQPGDAESLPLSGEPRHTLRDRLVACLVAIADTFTLVVLIAFSLNFMLARLRRCR